MDSLIYAPEFEALHDRFLQAGRDLVAKGVRAVVGGCGFMILFQRELAEELPVPVYSSSLMQLPLIAQSLPANSSIGVITASGSSLSPRHMDIACAGLPIRYVIGGLENRPAFKAAVHDQVGTLDFEAVQSDVVAEALVLQQANSDLRAILLECTDLPPYADAVAQATGLPVYDITTLINWAHQSVEPPRYPHPR
jgi:Asp/Glu/hydantoin racemase